MNDILVSVVMLCYNHEKYIRQALESVLNQKTDFRYEVIVHEDASTDGSAAILREMEEKYPDKLRPVYQTENQYSQGVLFKTKFVEPMIRGKYVANCECDDYWCDENKLQKQVDILEKNPYLVACVHNCYLVDGDDKSIGDTYSAYRLCKEHIYTLRQLAVGAFFPGQTASLMYRREKMEFLSMEQRIDFRNFRIRLGDQKRSLHLLLQGDIYYMAARMSVHRVVLTGGNSWSSRIYKKNQAFDRFASSIDFRAYAKKYYGKTFPNYYTTFRAGVYAFKKRLIKPTEEDKKIFRKVCEEKGGLFSLILYLVGIGLLALPLCVERYVDQRKYRLKQGEDK